MTAEHVAPEDAKWITPADELDDIELGRRVTNQLTAWRFAGLFALVSDRRVNAISILTAQVAASTSWRGLPFPPEWELPDDWRVPREPGDSASSPPT